VTGTSDITLADIGITPGDIAGTMPAAPGDMATGDTNSLGTGTVIRAGDISSSSFGMNIRNIILVPTGIRNQAPDTILSGKTTMPTGTVPITLGEISRLPIVSQSITSIISAEIGRIPTGGIVHTAIVHTKDVDMPNRRMVRPRGSHLPDPINLLSKNLLSNLARSWV
jgi:hypothetical protein